MKISYYLFMVVGLVALALTAATQWQQSEPQQAPETAEEKWQIVNYWSEWCAPCRVEIPMLNKLNETLTATNVTVVGVNFDEDPREKTLAIANDIGIKFPTLTLAEVTDLQLRYPDVLPTTYIISPDNEVVATMVGEQTYESMQSQLADLNLPEKPL